MDSNQGYNLYKWVICPLTWAIKPTYNQLLSILNLLVSILGFRVFLLLSYSTSPSPTWRIIPVDPNVWLVTMVRIIPVDGSVVRITPFTSQPHCFYPPQQIGFPFKNDPKMTTKSRAPHGAFKPTWCYPSSPYRDRPWN